jgi:hypothetical protein
MSVKIGDHTEEQFVSIFGDEGAKLTGMPAAKLMELQNTPAYDAIAQVGRLSVLK